MNFQWAPHSWCFTCGKVAQESRWEKRPFQGRRGGFYFERVIRYVNCDCPRSKIVDIDPEED